MKFLLKIFYFFLTIIYVVVELAEALALPAIFVVAGILNELPWQYYAATVGGYFLVCIIIQIVLHFVFKRFEKKYESALVKLFKKKASDAKENKV